MNKYIPLALIIILIACSDKLNQPTIQIQNELSQVVYKQDNKLILYSYVSNSEEIILNVKDKSIVSFDYNYETGNVFMVLFETKETGKSYYTSLVKMTKDGDLIEINKDSTREGEGFHSFENINVSINERYLALDGLYYEGGFFAVYDLLNNKYIQFDGQQYTEYLEFFMWDPDENGIYVKSHQYLVYYDLIRKTISMLDGPNIREYLTEEYLLKNGFIGERYDYSIIIGINEPQFVNWNSTGDMFVYLSNNSLVKYDLLSSHEQEILNVEDDVTYYGNNFNVLWNSPIKFQFSQSYFDDSDLIISFDSSIIKNISNLNDSLYYSIEKSYSISYLRLNWNNLFNSWDKYYFKREISTKKFHVAEFDFHMWYYALRMTPEFWFLVLKIDHENFNKDDFIKKYELYLSKYHDNYIYFKNLNFPSDLQKKRSNYEQYHLKDIRFQELFLNFFKSSDTLEFKSKLYELLNDEDQVKVDSVFTILNNTNLSVNRRLLRFYAAIHNTFLNFYGKIIAKDIDKLKIEYQIERLEEDWIHKTNGIITQEYLREKKYIH